MNCLKGSLFLDIFLYISLWNWNGFCWHVPTHLIKIWHSIFVVSPTTLKCKSLFNLDSFFSLCNAKNEEKANLAIYLIKLQKCLLDYHKKRLPCHFFLQVRWKSKISMIHWKWKEIDALKVKRLISNTLSLGINLRHEIYKNTNENHSFERKMRSIRLIYDYIWCVSYRRTVKLITAISIFIKQWWAKKASHTHTVLSK